MACAHGNFSFSNKHREHNIPKRDIWFPNRNITTNSRVSAIFVDYPSRTRLKVRGAAVYHSEPSADLVTKLGGDHIRGDGAVIVDVVATDWNCPKYITPRFTSEQVALVSDPLNRRIEELESRLATYSE